MLIPRITSTKITMKEETVLCFWEILLWNVSMEHYCYILQIYFDWHILCKNIERDILQRCILTIIFSFLCYKLHHRALASRIWGGGRGRGCGLKGDTWAWKRISVWDNIRNLYIYILFANVRGLGWIESIKNYGAQNGPPKNVKEPTPIPPSKKVSTICR